ncbi:MAG: hypothetical protein GWP91_20975 [Rhodobacterales bacterium]|nr:hypothetical protein [Rhodobacterales bacterium]
MNRVSLLVLVALMGCDRVSWLGAKANKAGPVDTASAIDVCEDPPDWEQTVGPILLQWCVGCHTSHLAGPDRSGAPEGIDFDTYTGAVSHAAAIDRVAGGDDWTMPPSGGVTDEERGLLRQWVACGAPGVPEEPDFCDTPKWFWGSISVEAGETTPDNWCGEYNRIAGSLVARDGGDLTAIASCVCEIDGDLVLEQAGGTRFDFVELQAVTGTIQITALGTGETVPSQISQNIQLPVLLSAGGLQITEHPALAEVYAPYLADLSLPDVGLVVQNAGGDIDVRGLFDVAGPLDVRGNALLTSLALDRLSTVAGAYTVVDNPLLSVLDTRSITWVEGGINVSDNPMLDWDVPFRDLLHLEGDIRVENNASMTSMGGFNWLLIVPGSLVIQDLPMVASISEFPVLTEVQGDLLLVNLASLTTLDAFDVLNEVEGTLEIRSATALETYTSFLNLERVGGGMLVTGTSLTWIGAESLTQVGALLITDNANVTDLTDFDQLVVVTGDVTVSGSAQLIDLSGLEGIQWIGGTLQIGNNASLTGVNGLFGLAAVGGDVSFVDNPVLSSSDIDAVVANIGLEDIGGTVLIEGNAP